MLLDFVNIFLLRRVIESRILRVAHFHSESVHPQPLTSLSFIILNNSVAEMDVSATSADYYSSLPLLRHSVGRIIRMDGRAAGNRIGIGVGGATAKCLYIYIHDEVYRSSSS